MERVNRLNLDYTVETDTRSYGLETRGCTWEEAFDLFNENCADEEVCSCSVYYLDSKKHRREVLTYTAPLDY